MLARPCAGLQGVNVQAELPVVGGACTSRPERPSADQESPVFLRNAGPHRLDVGLAAIGSGKTITGQGELMRVALDQGGAAS